MLAGLGGTLNAKGEFIARNLDAGRYRFEIKLPTEAWYVRVINLPTAVAVTNQQPLKQRHHQPPSKAEPALSLARHRHHQVRPTSQRRFDHRGTGCGEFAGRVTVTPEGTAFPEDLHVHLVPADREQAGSTCFATARQ